MVQQHYPRRMMIVVRVGHCDRHVGGWVEVRARDARVEGARCWCCHVADALAHKGRFVIHRVRPALVGGLRHLANQELAAGILGLVPAPHLHACIRRQVLLPAPVPPTITTLHKIIAEDARRAAT